MSQTKAISRFRSPASNARYTRLLFWDNVSEIPSEERSIEPLYTLHHDRPGLVNFRRRYVALGDPSGYLISQELLEDFDHWQLLMKSPWFRAAKERWDAELDAKLAAEGLRAVRAIVEGDESVLPSVQLSAAKYLANLDHRKAAKSLSGGTGRGRPSKEEVAGELRRETESVRTLEADLKRIRGL